MEEHSCEILQQNTWKLEENNRNLCTFRNRRIQKTLLRWAVPIKYLYCKQMLEDNFSPWLKCIFSLFIAPEPFATKMGKVHWMYLQISPSNYILTKYIRLKWIISKDNLSWVMSSAIKIPKLLTCLQKLFSTLYPSTSLHNWIYAKKLLKHNPWLHKAQARWISFGNPHCFKWFCSPTQSQTKKNVDSSSKSHPLRTLSFSNHPMP